MKLYHVHPATTARVRLDGWPNRATPTTLLAGLDAHPDRPLTASNSAGCWFDEYSGMFTVITDDILTDGIRATLAILVELRDCHVQPDGERTPRPGHVIVARRFFGRTRELVGAGDNEFVATGVDRVTMARTVNSADLGDREAVYSAGIDGLMLWCNPDTSDLYRYLTQLPAVTVTAFDGFVLPDDTNELVAQSAATVATPEQIRAVHDAWQTQRASATGHTDITEHDVTDRQVTITGATSGQDWCLRASLNGDTWMVSVEWGDLGNGSPAETLCNPTVEPYAGPPSGAIDLTVIGFAPRHVTRVETLRANGAVSATAIPQLLDVGFAWYTAPIRHHDVDRVRFVIDHHDPIVEPITPALTPPPLSS